MGSENKNIDTIVLFSKVLSGDATPDELKQLNDWKSASASNQQAFDNYVKLWKITGTASSVPDDINIDVEWQKLESTVTPKPSKPIRLIGFLKVAASIVLIASLAFIGVRITGIRSVKSHAAETTIIKLPDGSTLSLNAGSKATYKKGFGITNRNIRLKGEGYFEVEKNAELPFIINAYEACIHVSGTKFNVKAYKEKSEIKVMVTEGVVSFYQARDSSIHIVLHEGETGIYNKEIMAVKKETVVNMNDLAWKTGIIELNNTPLTEVAEILMNTYHTPVDIDPGLKNCTVTVRFESQELDSILKVLESTLEIDIVNKGKRIIISGNGC